RSGIEADGNAPFDPQDEFTHKNLLYTARPIEEIAAISGRPPGDIASSLERSRIALRHARARRPRPHLDDKVLTAWNGLMIAAFARVARVLRFLGPDGRESGQPYLHAAQTAAAFIHDRMWTHQTLLRRFRDGDAAIDAYAEDYAYLISGLLELFQTDADPRWLEWTADLQAALMPLAPWIASMQAAGGAAAAYVCRNFACERPVTTAEALTQALDANAQSLEPKA